VNGLAVPASPGRIRSLPGLRRLTREATLDPGRLILPLFVTDDPSAVGPIASLPGVRRHAPEELGEVVGRAAALGVPALLLFGVPRSRGESGAHAADPAGPVARGIAEIRSAVPDLVVMTDVCLCAYRSDGHCGPRGRHGLATGETHELLAAMAVAHAAAGADTVAPSAMIDGQVAALRRALDDAGFADRSILAYSAKYASAFYGPFREAARSAPSTGDRRGHQMDPANGREALAEVALDLAEGADLVMVKPAGPCLDVVARVRDAYPAAPLVAYQVSGELAMIEAAAERGWVDRRAVLLESLTALRRAGADAVITYAALEVAGWLREESP
jgi:porphobilinogen synthase